MLDGRSDRPDVRREGSASEGGINADSVRVDPCSEPVNFKRSAQHRALNITIRRLRSVLIVAIAQSGARLLEKLQIFW